MNREIKFRAFWNGNMHRVNTVSMDGLTINIDMTGIEGYTAHDSKWVDVLNEPKAMLMQYTGLKDKNGKEIYEGDVLHMQIKSTVNNNNIIVEIYFQNGVFWFKGKFYSDCNWHFYNARDREVIGNIYENPELINSK